MELLSEIQHKFYNISRIMDCISCDKCRLNGKVQVRGLATTLKALFLPDSKKADILKQISNQEIVSIIQLLSKLSESLNILTKHRVEELKFAQQVFLCQMIAQFGTSTLLSVLLLLPFGINLTQDSDSEESSKSQHEDKNSSKVV